MNGHTNSVRKTRAQRGLHATGRGGSEVLEIIVMVPFDQGGRCDAQTMSARGLHQGLKKTCGDQNIVVHDDRPLCLKSKSALVPGYTAAQVLPIVDELTERIRLKQGEGVIGRTVIHHHKPIPGSLVARQTFQAQSGVRGRVIAGKGDGKRFIIHGFLSDFIFYGHEGDVAGPAAASWGVCASIADDPFKQEKPGRNGAGHDLRDYKRMPRLGELYTVLQTSVPGVWKGNHRESAGSGTGWIERNQGL